MKNIINDIEETHPCGTPSKTFVRDVFNKLRVGGIYVYSGSTELLQSPEDMEHELLQLQEVFQQVGIVSAELEVGPFPFLWAIRD